MLVDTLHFFWGVANFIHWWFVFQEWERLMGFLKLFWKKKKKAKKHWATSVGKTPENIASVHMKRFSTAKRATFTNHVLQHLRLLHESMKKQKRCEAMQKRNKKTGSYDFRMVEFVWRTHTELFKANNQGRFRIPGTNRTHLIGFHLTHTEQQLIHNLNHPPFTTYQMIEYERHNMKLVPKPAVTFQTNAVWLTGKFSLFLLHYSTRLRAL